ncbi:thiol:disulfide interchange protein DsbD [Kaistia soli DSM 19436]|uniref:Thiol:disulfide interchange protein DsbD n=1 Tax=Kaistia soli DSM 19436 TaxID=1122133 RepID=A0A1M5E0D8_9HYPH|nr:protein-disulfide reductase DsbD [Kaistia soli]SHF72650.1 thiol:disulfide interchange protein DsbD [Kaistia soli DSM 19436]
MPKTLQPILATVLVLLSCALPGAAMAQLPRPADEVFRLTVTRPSNGDLRLHWTIAPGTYLYRDKLAAAGDAGGALRMATAPGTVKDDPTFGLTEIYHGEAAAMVAASDLQGNASLHITYQGCAEQGVCYPPVTKTVDLASLAVSPAGRGGVSLAGSEAPTALEVSGAKPAGTDQPSPALLAGNIGVMAISFLGFGLLLAFTPCVFPMIPILSGILTRSGDGLTPRRGFVLSSAYAVAMALAYAMLGVAAAWSGQNLQIALQMPATLGLMSLVFVILALSMFGFVDLQLPAAWSTRLTRLPATGGGTLGGAALLGFVSALIVGPCVTPPLAAALLYVAQTGDQVRGGMALFALGLGMGLPLIAFGTFGSKVLPKSGRWLGKVKQAFGFVFLGLAIWMLARFLPGVVTQLLWGILAIAGGVWLGGCDLIRGKARLGGRLGPEVLGVAAALYGIVLIAGAAAGGSPDHRPPPGASARGASSAVRTVVDPAEFDKALAAARAEGRPILIDFTAQWCTACVEMDRTVMQDPATRARLETLSTIRVDLSDYSAGGQTLMRRFDVVGPPTLLFIDPATGREIDGARTIGAVSTEEFSQTLSRAGA